MEDKDAYTIPEHCKRHGYSVSHYFEEKRKGNGPREMHVGHRVLISKEAAAEWRREREKAAETVHNEMEAA